MAVIAIFSGSYCRADEVAEKVIEKLGYDVLGDELLNITSEKYNVPSEKLLKTIQGPTLFFNRITRDKEHFVAYLKATLADQIKKNNVVYHGFASLLLPDDISHILKICIIADHKFRVKMATASEGMSEKDADNAVRKDDNKNFQWSQYVTGIGPYDEEHYDIVIPMHDSSPEAATEIIVENARKKAVATTAESEQAMADFVLASKVNVALTENNHDVEVFSSDGKVTILINKYVTRLEQKKDELRKIAESIPGVEQAEVKIGPRYHVPSIYPPEDFDAPPKVLLVDDEKEFVHTLSERLQTRNLESAVVYDGEEALSFVEGDEPEVIVLDLKMPGIDGIEVLRKVKQNHPATEVIILTGHGSDREEKMAAELGAFAYLQKPVDIDKLSETMKQAYKKIRSVRDSRSDSGNTGN